GLDRALLGIVEARPAGAALELLLRHEQRLAAARALERAGALLEIERAAPRPLGTVAAQHLILLRREQAAPLRVAMRYPLLFGVDAACLRYSPHCVTHPYRHPGF